MQRPHPERLRNLLRVFLQLRVRPRLGRPRMQRPLEERVQLLRRMFLVQLLGQVQEQGLERFFLLEQLMQLEIRLMTIWV